MSDEEIIIATSDEDRYWKDSRGRLTSGTEVIATAGGVNVRGRARDEYDIPPVSIPWADILKHAPVAALVAEMERRKFQVKSEDDLYNDWAEAREAEP